MKKGTKKFLLLSTVAVAGMHAYNKYVSVNSTKKNTLPTKDGAYYSWKHGNVFYTKSGSGSPVLLIHDTNSANSSIEWSKITKRLRRNHTVYTIDLLGCGLSDKPSLSYTNYMYVQLITAFIKDVIKEKTDIVASNMSGSFVIMANHLDDSIINRIILINPISMKTLENMPDNISKIKKFVINLPIVGTFLYNLMMSPKTIDHHFRSAYFSRPQLITDYTKEAFYESAHMDNSSGKYLYSSILGNYMNISIRHAVESCKNKIFIVGSKDISNNLNTIEEYRKLNSQISVTYISNCKLYPQLENPEKTYQIIQAILQK
jgi:pimeloyl-ACP methyl ester carboxylesterase